MNRRPSRSWPPRPGSRRTRRPSVRHRASPSWRRSPVASHAVAPATPVSFRKHVIPVLTKMGCNSGACHGAAAGKNGFALTLRGYDPDADYDTITRAAAGRRVNKLEPAKSLLLLKPTETRAAHGRQAVRGRARPSTPCSPGGSPRACPAPRDTRPVADRHRRDARVRDAGGRRHAAAARRGAVLRRLARGRHALGAIRLGRRERRAGGRQRAAHACGGTARRPSRSAFSPAWRSRACDRRSRTTIPGLGLRAGRAVQPVRSTWCWPSCASCASARRRCAPTPSSSAARTWTRPASCPRATRSSGSSPTPSPDKRARLVDALLERQEFVDYWAYKWSDLLLVSSRSLGRSNVRTSTTGSARRWRRTCRGTASSAS